MQVCPREALDFIPGLVSGMPDSILLLPSVSSGPRQEIIEASLGCDASLSRCNLVLGLARWVDGDHFALFSRLFDKSNQDPWTRIFLLHAIERQLAGGTDLDPQARGMLLKTLGILTRGAESIRTESLLSVGIESKDPMIALGALQGMRHLPVTRDRLPVARLNDLVRGPEPRLACGALSLLVMAGEDGALEKLGERLVTGDGAGALVALEHVLELAFLLPRMDLGSRLPDLARVLRDRFVPLDVDSPRESVIEGLPEVTVVAGTPAPSGSAGRAANRIRPDPVRDRPGSASRHIQASIGSGRSDPDDRKRILENVLDADAGTSAGIDLGASGVIRLKDHLKTPLVQSSKGHMRLSVRIGLEDIQAASTSLAGFMISRPWLMPVDTPGRMTCRTVSCLTVRTDLEGIRPQPTLRWRRHLRDPLDRRRRQRRGG